MTKSPEQLDEFIRQAQAHGDVSAWQRNPEDTGLVNIVSILNNIPKTDAPKANLLRVRNRILDKISLPSDMSSDGSYASGFFRVLPRFLRITGGIVGAFTIMLSLTIGTAVAALESVPGQTIYPVKRMVESVQLRLANDQEQKTNLQIKFANNRVDELEVILQKQKEGKASEEEVQKVVADAVKGIQETSEAVADQSKDEPQVALLTKIVTLTDKQTAVISAAQAGQEEGTEANAGLNLALEASKTAKEMAIENIERAGLVVEDQPLTISEPGDENAITTEGKLTYIDKDSISIGNTQFVVTGETKYANITFEDLEVGATVKITAITQGRYTYVTEIEVTEPAPKDEKPESEGGEVEGAKQQAPPTGGGTVRIPANPQ